MSAPETIVSELAPQGVLRAGINFGNPVIAQRDAAGAAVQVRLTEAG